MTPELAPVQVGAEGWGQGVVRILGWVLRGPGLGEGWAEWQQDGDREGREKELENLG